ncbi:MAG: hypothetical protein IJC46_05635 [Clostridia bacterium]|nr:hypothetical protein [Clostridia bacterium]
MFKKILCRRIALATILTLLLVTLGFNASAQSDASSDALIGETPLIPISEGSDSSAVAPCGMTFGGSNPWCTFVTSATAYYAPYGTGCASTGKTFTAGQGAFLVSRDYDYYYVYWYENQKEVYGYVPISSLNITGFAWTQYDIYRPGVCTATTQVLSFAGTTNTYKWIGEIYADEYPLMVLGSRVNPYNNVTYYFIQYLDGSGLVKRGWVDASLGTVTYSLSGGSDVINALSSSSHLNEVFIVNKATQKALSSNVSTNSIYQINMNGILNQAFHIVPTTYNGSSTGYYQIIPAGNTSLALQISGTGFAEGLSVVLAPRTTNDKRQEFKFEIWHHRETTGELRFYVTIMSRCTGHYRALEMNNGNLVQSELDYAANQTWEVYGVTDTWDGTYGLYGGSAHPGNYKVKVDDSMLDDFTLDEIQDCVDQWNTLDGNFSIEVTTDATASNVLAIIEKKNLSQYDRTDSNGHPDGMYLGLTSPRFVVNGVLTVDTSQNRVNEKWHSTMVYIDLDRIRTKYPAENTFRSMVLKIIIHELGHSLKLSHTYQRLFVEDPDITGPQDVNWYTTDQSISVMNPSPDAMYSFPVTIDIRRFVTKWDIL